MTNTKAKLEGDMNKLPRFPFYIFMAVVFSFFCSMALAQQADGKTKKQGADKSTSESKDPSSKNAGSKNEKPFETWPVDAADGSAKKSSSNEGQKSEPQKAPQPQAKTKASEQSPKTPVQNEPQPPKGTAPHPMDAHEGEMNRSVPKPPEGTAPHPMDAHEGEMNRSVPKPPPPVRHAAEKTVENKQAKEAPVVRPVEDHEYDLHKREREMNNAPSRRYKRYDIGVSTGFGAGASDSFSRASSVIWKVSGEFFFDHVGFSPFVLADKGRDLGSGDLTFFVSFGLQLKYRFFTDRVFQPYLSAGAAVAISGSNAHEDATAGPLAGVGALVKLSDIFYLHLDSFLLFAMGNNTDTDYEYMQLGDLIFVATAGVDLLF